MYKGGKRLAEFVLIAKTFRADLLDILCRNPLRSPYTRFLICPSPTLSKVEYPHQRPPARPGEPFRPKNDQGLTISGHPSKRNPGGEHLGSEERRSGVLGISPTSLRPARATSVSILPRRLRQRTKQVFLPVVIGHIFLGRREDLSGQRDHS